MMAESTVNDKMRGCIIGGALGDAVGLFTEFLSRDQAIAQYGTNPRFKLRRPAVQGYEVMLMDYHRASFDEAAWTDDTDHSLLILMSFLHDGGSTVTIDPSDFAARLRYWVRFGFRPLETLATDVGRTIGTVVNDAKFLENPQLVASRVWEQRGRSLAANGAVMRTPVVGALFFDKPNVLYDVSIDLAAVTHADPRCLVSCTIVSALVAALIRGEVHNDADIQRIVTDAISPVSCRAPLQGEHIEELHSLIWKPSLLDLQLDEEGKIGYTYKCLAAGICALRQVLAAMNSSIGMLDFAFHFERIITDITMCGGDADTNAAVAGSLLGSLVGYSNLPKSWAEDLRHRDWLLSKVDAASYLIVKEGTPYDYTNDPDNLIDGGKGSMTGQELNTKWKLFYQIRDQRITAARVHKK